MKQKLIQGKQIILMFSKRSDDYSQWAVNALGVC